MSIEIGPFRISSIHTGFLSLDGGAMFGTVPKVLWERQQPPDEKNRIRLAMRAMLIEGEGRNILVDCGLGDKGGEKFKDMFAVDQATHSLEKSLQARGLALEDMTDVILTHLHFDHAGGATYRSPEGDWRPTFPNATYYIQKRNLKVAQNPNPRERASYLPEIYESLLKRKQMHELDGNLELFPGIEIWVSNGHTEAQQHVLVSDGKTSVFYGGDLIPTHSHLPLAWVMGYDLHPLKMIEEKEIVLSRANQENWILFYEHDPSMAAQYVVKNQKGYAAGDVVDVCGV